MLEPTFRDPDARLTFDGDRVLRTVRPEAARSFAAMLEHAFVARLMDEGRLVRTTLARCAEARGSSASDEVCYEHERIPFVSYPFEWSPAMLARAAEFTLTLCLQLLEHGFLLKDATPSNVLFRSTTPVFVDVPSIVARSSGVFIWRAQDQFERCFLLPLIANVEAGIPISWSLQDPARGLAHEQLARMLGIRGWLKPTLFASVVLPASLNRVAASMDRKNDPTLLDDARAKFTLARTLERNVVKIRRLARRLVAAQSMWRDYTETRSHYGADDVARKNAFVSEALAAVRPRWVLDVGANTGEFSAHAAAAGASVVALDTDETAVSNMLYAAERNKHSILPLVGDFANPSPAVGWSNRERASFLSRAEQHFDVVLLLAVIHHLRVTCGVPLAQILGLAADLARKAVVIEHVPIEDPMFKRLSRGRDELYADCQRSEFEKALRTRFDLDKSAELTNGRTLYLARKRA